MEAALELERRDRTPAAELFEAAATLAQAALTAARTMAVGTATAAVMVTAWDWVTGMATASVTVILPMRRITIRTILAATVTDTATRLTATWPPRVVVGVGGYRRFR